MCINGWTDKNLSLLGVDPTGLERRELSFEEFNSCKFDEIFDVCPFEDCACLLRVHDDAKLIIDVGMPPADLKKAMFSDIVQTMRNIGLEKNNIFIRLQREGDIKLWNAQKFGCALMYFLPDSSEPEERETKQAKALNVCEKYKIKYISVSSGTYTDETAKLLKDKGLLPVVFSYDKLVDAVEAVERGAEMVGTFYYSSKYAEKLLK